MGQHVGGALETGPPKAPPPPPWRDLSIVQNAHVPAPGEPPATVSGSRMDIRTFGPRGVFQHTLAEPASLSTFLGGVPSPTNWPHGSRPRSRLESRRPERTLGASL